MEKMRGMDVKFVNPEVKYLLVADKFRWNKDDSDF